MSESCTDSTAIQLCTCSIQPHYSRAMISIRENVKILKIPDWTANTESGECILVWGTSLRKCIFTTGENIKSVRSCTVTYKSFRVRPYVAIFKSVTDYRGHFGELAVRMRLYCSQRLLRGWLTFFDGIRQTWTARSQPQGRRREIIRLNGSIPKFPNSVPVRFSYFCGSQVRLLSTDDFETFKSDWKMKIKGNRTKVDNV